jgi:hypothetical protein
MQDFTRTARHIVNADTDYFSCLDEWRRGDDQMLLLHCYFLKVTPRVFRRVLDEWRVLRRVTDAPIYCVGDEDDGKYLRFVERFGFQAPH